MNATAPPAPEFHDTAHTSGVPPKKPPRARQVRRLAMQVLYQMDMTGEVERQEIEAGLDEASHKPAVRQAGVALALRAWEAREQADQRVRELAPTWPTHRQPPVDRAILRLAVYEMVSGRVPTRVAINEAVELAKWFGSEQSPAFINGVLDKIGRDLTTVCRDQPAVAADDPVPGSSIATDADAWLADATGEDGNR